MTANVITYRGRSAAREAGKALGFDAATLDRLTKLVSAWEWKDKDDSLARNVQVAGQDAGLDLQHPRIAKLRRALPAHAGPAAPSRPALRRHGDLRADSSTPSCPSNPPPCRAAPSSSGTRKTAPT